MSVGEHTVTVYPGASSAAWSAPIASNPYLTSDLVGWLAGPFAPALVWNPNGSTTAPTIARDHAYPVARTPATAYRVRVTFSLDRRSAVTWGLNYGITAFDAYAGPFWQPDNATAQTTWGGFDPGTYTVESVLDPASVDPRYLYLAPIIYTWGDDAPPVTLTTIELVQRLASGVEISCLVDEVAINHGRDDSGSQPEASSATVTFTATPADPLPIEVDVGATIVVATSTTGDNASTRFYGRITDLALGWDEAGQETPDAGVGQIVAVGPLADLGRRVVGATPWPQELDGARVSRVMTAAGITLDPFTSDPGTVLILARDVDSQPALDVARDAATSASGLVWETKGGEIRYADADHRRGIPSSLTLDACDVLVTPSWRRTIEGLVNEVSIGYGLVPAARNPRRPRSTSGGEQPRYVDASASSVARWGHYGYTTTTELATLADAQAMGRLLLARNSSPVWVMASLPVDVAGLDVDPTAALLGLDLHSLITLTGLPGLGTAPTSASLWVEGWRETLAYGVHEIELVVSGYCRTAPPPRWDDVSPSWLWGGTTRTLTRSNRIDNPAMRAGAYGVEAAAPVTISTVDGKQWASVASGAYLNVAGFGAVVGNYYAASCLVGGPPGTEFFIDTTDYVVGSFTGYAQGVIPASGSIRADLPSRVPIQGTGPRVSLANPAGIRITEVMVAPVAGPGMRTGAYFDGATQDTTSNDYAWEGADDHSASTESAISTIAGGVPPDLTWDGAACFGPPGDLGRWNDTPATLRWDAVPPASTWDTYTTPST